MGRAAKGGTAVRQQQPLPGWVFWGPGSLQPRLHASCTPFANRAMHGVFSGGGEKKNECVVMTDELKALGGAERAPSCRMQLGLNPESCPQAPDVRFHLQGCQVYGRPVPRDPISPSGARREPTSLLGGLLGLPASPPQHAGTSPWPCSMAPCGSHHEAFSGTKRTN